jgi:hypothetical protein
MVAADRFLQHCGGDWRFTNLGTGAVSDVAIPLATELRDVPAAVAHGVTSGAPPFVLRLGDDWMEEEGIGNPSQEPPVTLFNPSTGEVVPLPETGAHAYVDVNAANPVQPLCPPVALPVRTRDLIEFHRPVGTRAESWKVIGVSHGWIVALDFSDELIAWHCDTAAPHLIAERPDPGSVQVGAGIVTWLEDDESGGLLFAERLSTGRRWDWASRYGFITGLPLTAVHTSRAVYAAENCPAACVAHREVEPIVKASLTGL